MSLLLWYPFTSNGYNYGSAPGTTFSPSLVDQGKLGKCVKASTLPTSDTGISMLNNWNPLRTSLTMSCWVKFDQTEVANFVNGLSYNDKAHSATGGVLGYGYYGGVAIHWISSTMWVNNKKDTFKSMQVFACIRGKNSYGDAYLPNFGFTTVPLGKWLHLVLVCDKEAGMARFYVNGNFIAQGSIADLAAMNGDGNFHIGGAMIYSGNGPSGRLPFYINDIRLYDQALSREEIRVLGQGLMIHYNFEEHENVFDAKEYLKSPVSKCSLSAYGGNGMVFTSSGNDPYTNNYATAVSQDKGSKIAFPVKAGYTYYLSWRHVSGLEFNKNIYSLYDANNKSVVMDASSTYKGFSTVALGSWRRAAITIPSGSQATQLSIRLGNASLASGASIIIDNIMLSTYDGSNFTMPNDGSKVTDVSGNGYHGTAIDLIRSTNSALGTSTGVFNGSTSCVDVPLIRKDQFCTPYTLNMWTYINDNDRAVLFGDHAMTGGVSMNFERRAGGAFRYYHAADISGQTFSKTIIPYGSWAMITFTSDGTKIKSYINGVLKDEYTYTPTIIKNSGIMRIGRDNRSDYTALAGRVADFRWYGTALSANDIDILYRSFAAVDNDQCFSSGEIFEDEELTEVQITPKHQTKMESIIETNIADLPIGYTPLQYIQSNGTQYIDTGFVPNQNTRVYAEAQLALASAEQALFGSRVSSKANQYQFVTEGSQYRTDYNTACTYISSQNYGANKFFVIKDKNFTNLNNDTTYTHAYANFSAPGNMYIFATNHNGAVNAKATAKLYVMKIYDNGTLIRHFVPCKKSNGAVGLYDVANQTFYSNAGSGSFIAGPPANKVGIFGNGLLEANKINEV